MRLADLGFEVLATEGTALVLRRHGVAGRGGPPSTGRDPTDCVERILRGDVALVFNTPWGSPGNSGPRLDGYEIRTAAVSVGIPCVTTVQGMTACVQGSRRCAGARSGCGRCRSCTPSSGGSRRERECSQRGPGRPGDRGGAEPAPGGRLPPARGGGRRDRRAGPPGPVRRRVGGRAGQLDAAAPVVRAVPGHPDGGVLGDGPVRGRRAGAGHRVAGRGPAGRPAGPGRSARDAVPAARRPGRLPAGRRRLRLGAAVRPRRRAARPGVPGRLPARGGHRTSGSSASWRPSGRRVR